MCKLAEVHIIACERHFALVCGEGEAYRAPDGMLKCFPQKQSIGSAETIVVVAGKPGVAVDV